MTLAATLRSLNPSGVISHRSSATRIMDTMRMNGSDGFLGAGVTIFGESNRYDLDLTGEDEVNTGVIVGEAGGETDLSKDASSPYADNQKVLLMIPMPADVFYMCAKTAATITYGKAVQVDGGFVEDTDWSASESAANIHPLNIPGIALEAVTGVSGIEAYLKILKV